MLDKNVCPNCGQLYDTALSKCPLCGTAPQVVEAVDPIQRKRITDAERRQRRADRKEAEQEARRRAREARFLEDEEEELKIEEEDAQRREEKRRLKEEKKAARRAARNGEAPDASAPLFTPAPAQDGRGPMPEVYVEKDRRRVPRVFLALSTAVLSVTLLVGGTYLLWKLDVAKLPIYDRLSGRSSSAEPVETGSKPPETTTAATEAPVSTTLFRGEGAIPCTGVTLSQSSLVFTDANEQTQLQTELHPADTTDERRFSTSDPAVVKVSPVGIVTAVGPGEATITVLCGEEQAVCTVLCDFAAPTAPTLSPDLTELVLIKDDMSFFTEGESYTLSVTNIPAGTPVEWRSLDESVATVDEGGRVVAVGQGTTRIIATVGDLSAECWVRCPFTEEG
ncbi:MAG: Ig-like domain-containing protein [Oscillospiraceae bacterium]|nr:Ig-like domain-containing protein [Oscillospiraceae bacterium]